MLFKSKKKILSEYLNETKLLGLRLVDFNNAREFIDRNELGLAFDIVVEQLYEYDIKIEQAFYESTKNVVDQLRIESTKYSFLEELIG